MWHRVDSHHNHYNFYMSFFWKHKWDLNVKLLIKLHIITENFSISLWSSGFFFEFFIFWPWQKIAFSRGALIGSILFTLIQISQGPFQVGRYIWWRTNYFAILSSSDKIHMLLIFLRCILILILIHFSLVNTANVTTH